MLAKVNFNWILELTKISVILFAEFSTTAESDVVLVDRRVLRELVNYFVSARYLGKCHESISQAKNKPVVLLSISSLVSNILTRLL